MKKPHTNLHEFDLHGATWTMERDGDSFYLHSVKAITDLSQFCEWLDTVRTNGDVIVWGVIRREIEDEAEEKLRHE